MTWRSADIPISATWNRQSLRIARRQRRHHGIQSSAQAEWRGLSNVLGQQAVANKTHVFSARLLNDLRLGYTRRGNTIEGATLSDTASAARNTFR